MNKNLLVICGATATGKTNLGIFLAKKLNGEVISADSRQIYKGIDIGTGKEISNIKYQISNIQIKNKKFITYKLKGVPVWLWDVISPDKSFSAVEYSKLAKMVIGSIQKRGKLPIIVGGTGFYIKALIDGVDTEGIKADWKLRKKLGNYDLPCRQAGITKLQNILKKLSPKRLEQMNNSDKNNPRRLIRAIEIAQFKKQHLHYDTVPYHSKHRRNKIGKLIFIGITLPNKVLYKRIDHRVDERVKQGIVKEIKSLLKNGYKWTDPGMNTLGCKQWKDWFDGKKSKEEIIQRWKFDEHNYARRQLTWFKKDKRIKWFDVEGLNREKILKFVKANLK